MKTPFQVSEEDSALAGEYVLGLLDDQAKVAFEKRLSTEGDLANETAFWQKQFAHLSVEMPREPHQASQWQHVESRLAPAVSSRGGKPGGGWLGWLTGSWALVASGAAVVLGINVYDLQTQAASPRYAAVMKSPDNTSEWLVEATAGGKVRLYQIGELPAIENAKGAGKAYQFWTKPPGAKGPTSLGLVELGKPLELPIEALPALVENQLFEVTLEPSTGSPYDRPSGPILFVGQAVALNQ